MHHKRKRPRSQRAGCKLCKYWKINGFTSRDGEEFEKYSDHIRRITAKQELSEETNMEVEFCKCQTPDPYYVMKPYGPKGVPMQGPFCKNCNKLIAEDA